MCAAVADVAVRKRRMYIRVVVLEMAFLQHRTAPPYWLMMPTNPCWKAVGTRDVDPSPRPENFPAAGFVLDRRATLSARFAYMRVARRLSKCESYRPAAPDRRAPLLLEAPMDYKDILVFLDATPDTPARVELATRLCERFGARLMGVDVSTPAAFEGESREAAIRLQGAFEAVLSKHAVKGEFLAASKRTSSWKDFYAHYADLVISSQRGEESAKVVARAIPEEVLLSAGVPVIILPSNWRPAAIGESIVIAWNSSRESTRAVHDALPLLRQAERVTIFEFDPPADSIDAAPDLIKAHLEHHGVSADLFTWTDQAGVRSVDALFACLDRQQADLIVAGAFGHSRLIEGTARKACVRAPAGSFP